MAFRLGWGSRARGTGPAARRADGPVTLLFRRRRRPVPDPVGDPFESLRVQLSLTRLEEEIDALQRGAGFARVHHLRAAMIAYDALLFEACRLAGVRLSSGPVGLRRITAEAELRARGWDW